MYKCWNCGNELDTRDKSFYVSIITEYRNSLDTLTLDDWQKGFLDGLNAAREILRES